MRPSDADGVGNSGEHVVHRRDGVGVADDDGVRRGQSDSVVARLTEEKFVSESAIMIGQPVCRQKPITRLNGAIRDGEPRQGMQTVTPVVMLPIVWCGLSARTGFRARTLTI